MTEAELAALNRSDFVAAFADIFEHSAWVAEGAWTKAPFHTFAALHEAMVKVLDAAGQDAAIAMIRAHPDLAGKAALAGEITDDSRAEQKASGLSTLTEEELANFTALNNAYKEKFGFPFVMAVRKSDKALILSAFESRLKNGPPEETVRALSEIKMIAQFRLEAISGQTA